MLFSVLLPLYSLPSILRMDIRYKMRIAWLRAGVAIRRDCCGDWGIWFCGRQIRYLACIGYSSKKIYDILAKIGKSEDLWPHRHAFKMCVVHWQSIKDWDVYSVMWKARARFGIKGLHCLFLEIEDNTKGLHTKNYLWWNGNNKHGLDIDQSTFDDAGRMKQWDAECKNNGCIHTNVHIWNKNSQMYKRERKVRHTICENKKCSPNPSPTHSLLRNMCIYRFNCLQVWFEKKLYPKWRIPTTISVCLFA